MTELLGAAMFLALPLGMVFCAMVKCDGWKMAATVFGLCAAALGWMYVSILLMNPGVR